MQQTNEFHAPADPAKSLVATLRSRNQQILAWQGGFIDSKAHVGSNLQKPIAALCTKAHKDAQFGAIWSAPGATVAGTRNKANVESQEHAELKFAGPKGRPAEACATG